jgi:hypothetical protein
MGRKAAPAVVKEWKDLLEPYLQRSVTISIFGEDGEDQAPPVRKILHKIECSPEGTHVELFFDTITFIAIPLRAKITAEEKQVTAFDTVSKLHYRVSSEN